MTQESKESPYKWVRHRKDDKLALIRTKYPRLAIVLEEEADEKQVADALKKAAEFLVKGSRTEQIQSEAMAQYRSMRMANGERVKAMEYINKG